MPFAIRQGTRDAPSAGGLRGCSPRSLEMTRLMWLLWCNPPAKKTLLVISILARIPAIGKRLARQFWPDKRHSFPHSRHVMAGMSGIRKNHGA